MDLIKLCDVTFQYDEGGQVIKNVSLSVGERDVVLLIGPTGSGKSTLLEIMAGVAPSVTGGEISGNAFIRDLDVLHNPGSARGIVGLVLQDPEPQLVNLTVEDEIAFGPENLLMSKEEVRARVNWALSCCRLEGQRKAFVYALSGGQKQRLAIAAGLAMKPEILLLDGPLTNLDPAGATEVLETIRDLIGKEVKTVVIASNKIDALLPLATRIIVMNEGRVVVDSGPEDVLVNYRQELSDLGLFVPEVSRLWSVLGEKSIGMFPRTPEDLAGKLNLRKPFLECTPKSIYQNGSTVVAEARDICFSYGANQVLKGVSFQVKKGEFLAIVGQNGSGKSTLASIICGLRQPKSGKMFVMGSDTSVVSPQRKVGYVFQYPEHQFVGRTVEEELRFGLANRMTVDELDQRTESILGLIGMESRRDESPYTLSVGAKRMLSVATMLMQRTPLLILDEPTTGLDQRLTENLMEILMKFVVEHDMTVIQVSHDMEQIAQYCHLVVVIDQGMVVFNSSPRKLFVNGVVHQARLEPPPVFKVARILFPDEIELPITVDQFLKEVQYARV